MLARVLSLFAEKLDGMMLPVLVGLRVWRNNANILL